MNNSIYYEKYCTGCGLCASQSIKMVKDSRDFITVGPLSQNERDFCNKVCPMSPNNCLKYHKHVNSIWGDYINYYKGHSNNPEIRYKASSGGVLTSIATFLLEEGYVDGVIHTTYRDDDPISCRTVVSKSVNDLIERCGSRYCSSSPLEDVENLIEKGKKYLFIGKPCDVRALQAYLRINKELENSIVYTMSFFCAGLPSRNANLKLINSLGAASCKKINYRGFGWPGKVHVVDYQDKDFFLSYEKAWMNILGRDIRYSCKFCFDSIGEFADISAGDLWNLKADSTPDFTEHDGENCIFAWTEKGKSILTAAQKSNYLTFNVDDINQLKYSQPNHYNRRTTMIARVIALKTFHRPAPKYNIMALIKFSRFTSMRNLLSTYKGTLKRISKKRI